MVILQTQLENMKVSKLDMLKATAHRHIRPQCISMKMSKTTQLHTAKRLELVFTV